MIEIPGPIPIAIHPLFWLLAAFLGFMLGQSMMAMFLWVGIIFVSVLFHELGHALTAVVFRQKARIQLLAFGGLTTFDGPKLSFVKQFLIALNGPIFGLILSGLGWWLRAHVSSPIPLYVVQGIFWINFFWSVVNLFPILPLDGGQLLRIAFEAMWGVKGYRIALFFGMALAGALSLALFALQQMLGGALFFLFAYQNFEMWRQGKQITASDRQEENRRSLLEAEQLLQQGKKEEAHARLEELVKRGGDGLLSRAALQYLAFLDMEAHRKEEAYNWLLKVPDGLSIEAKLLLHQLAEEHKNDALVASLSAEVYQFAPSAEVALRNARAFARLKKGKEAGGWLETAASFGPVDPTLAPFDALQSDPEFRSFLEALFRRGDIR